MRIVSVSLPEDLVDRVDGLADGGEYSGRSEIVRAALRPFLHEADTERGIEGEATATLTLGYDEAVSDAVNQIRHDHGGPITTMVHGHTKGEGCLEILVLEGEAEEIRVLAEDLRGRKGIHRAELVWL